MAIQRSIVRSIARSIAGSITGLLGRFFSVHGGVAYWGGPGSTAGGSIDFSITMTVKFAAADMGTEKEILSNILDPIPKFIKVSGNRMRLTYYTDGIGTTNSITTDTFHVAGETATFIISNNELGVQVLVNGIQEAAAGTPIFDPINLFLLNTVGNNNALNNIFNGLIYNIEYLNIGPFGVGGDFITGDGNNVNADFNLPLLIGEAFTVDVKYNANASIQAFIEGGNGTVGVT